MSQDYTVAKELASLKEIKQSAEQRISDLSLNALNYVNDHRLHKSGGGSEDTWPYFDAVVETHGFGSAVGVYLKGSYEKIKSAHDSGDGTFSILITRPKDEEEGDSAFAMALEFRYLGLQDDLQGFKYETGQYIYYFNQDNTINVVVESHS